MRRKDKEISVQGEITRIMEEALILHIALVDGERPYIIPVNFGYRDDSIYIHSASEGKKIDLIRKNNRVAFQAETGVEIVHKSTPDKCSMLYRSAAGYGRAFIVESLEEKKLGLELLMDHYHDKKLGEWVFGKCLGEVCIIKIVIEVITGKESLPRHID
jgi:hypothetical protein